MLLLNCFLECEQCEIEEDKIYIFEKSFGLYDIGKIFLLSRINASYLSVFSDC